MPKEYVCELCKKVFTQKGDLNKHSNKKQPCISLDKLKEIIKADDKNCDNKSNLNTIFKYCLDVLRDNEHLIGDKALRTLAHLLDLRLLEPQFGKTIDIDNYEYDFSHIEDKYIENHKKKLLTIVRFSKLAEEKEDNIPNNMKYLWDDILSVHPKTKNIFQKGKGFDITNQSTYKKLINKLNTFNFENIEADILGEAYEEVIAENMKGDLGQFFTPPQIKKMMVKLIDPQIKDDGTIEKIFDPAMGTGGFLITSVRHLIQKSKAKNINLNWNFVSKEGLGGREAEPDTYQLAVSNMMISTGHMFDVLEKGDSIRNPITNKYDIILANPPFGIKGLEYMEITNKLRNDYLPIKSNSAVPLFLQAIIYMLKVSGRCAVVLPDGQDLFSKTNKTLVSVREYLMKTCDLKEIIYLPSGVFTHTTIKTCVFYFVKKREGSDVLEVDVKYSKTTQKETKRDYKFSKTLQTKTVKFYDYNPYEDVKNLLVEVSIDKIVENTYSLNYAEYMKDETEEEQYEEGVVVKTLGEVCKFQNGYSFKSTNYEKQNETNIGILQIKSIQNGFIDENKITEYIEENKKYKLFEIQKGDILIGLTGTFKIGLYNLDKKSYLNQRVGKITAKKGIIQKYIYYWYLCCDIESEILKIAKGTAQANISTNEIANIKIPIPSLERQQEIVKYLDFIYEKIMKTSNDKISELKQLNQFYLNNQIKFGENVMKTLGDVIKEVKTGKDVVATERKKGEYPFYGANGIIDYVDSYIFDGKYLLTARTGSLGSLHITNGKFWCSGDVHRMEFENDTLLSYTYYYLQTIDFQKFRTGSAHPKLSGSSLKSIKIPIPSLERQKEIVEYCEFNDNLIKQLEKEIENNKNLAKQFITNIVKPNEEKPKNKLNQTNIINV
jgi:type I restriction-modification system DNA methylase subunit